MTETIPLSASPSDADLPVRSADILLNLVVTFLMPIFLGAGDGDINLARLAALETVNAYRANSHADLLAVAQIVAFGFATLGSLCLSMVDDLPLTMVLRLRGNANALSRSAEAHKRRLGQNRAEPGSSPLYAYEPAQPNDSSPHPPAVAQAAPPHAPPAVKAAVAPAQVSKPTPSTVSAIDPSQALWAAACAEAAEQITAEMPYLPPAERPKAAIQAAALNSCANDLLSGGDRAATQTQTE